jgi:SnoaL-like domain
MELSEEIRRVIHRWMIAISEGDNESALGRLSEHAGALMIGTDPAEWWHGQETRAIWGRQLEELRAFPVTWDEIEAWEEGTVGVGQREGNLQLAGEERRSARDVRSPPRARRVEDRADSLVSASGKH